MQRQNFRIIGKARRQKAFEKHTDDMQSLHSDAIEKSIENTVIYDGKKLDVSNVTQHQIHPTEFYVTDCDSVKAVCDARELCGDGVKIALLNFASYKHPGGGYIRGCYAQEEAICAESTLYNVISDSRFVRDYYTPHFHTLNYCAYTDESLYSPDIIFSIGDKEYVADVITCAAPNRSWALRYKKSALSLIDSAMKSRIDHLLWVAQNEGVEYLILGAFGCGVFKNDPNYVASIFKEMLTTKYKDAFKVVEFAIPFAGSANFDAFKASFEDLL